MMGDISWESNYLERGEEGENGHAHMTRRRGMALQ